MPNNIEIAFAVSLAVLAFCVVLMDRQDKHAVLKLESRINDLYERQQTLADRETVADLREAVDSLQDQVTSLDQIVTRLLEDTPDDERQADLLRWFKDYLAQHGKMYRARTYVGPNTYHLPLAANTKPEASTSEAIVHQDFLALKDAGLVEATPIGDTTYWHLLEID